MAGAQPLLCNHPHSGRDVVLRTPFPPRQRDLHSPKDRHRYGAGRYSLRVLAVFSAIKGYPSADAFKALPADEAAALKTGPWVLFVLYFFLTVAELFILRSDCRSYPKWLRSIFKVSARSSGWALRLWATFCSGSVRLSTTHARYGWAGLDSVPLRLHRIDGYHVRHGEVARACHQIMLRDASQGSHTCF